jgi:TPR repeat protein
LARELYKGDLIEQDINQSFDLMYQLAINDNYAEAICDLAQFYEYGVGVKADKKQALKLYDEAMQQGITRAMRHYDRLSKQKRKLFKLF